MNHPMNADAVIDFVGPDSYQGDVAIISINPKDVTLARDFQIEPKNGWLTVAEGEVTGHHHSIMARFQPTMFRDDALARDLGETPATPTTIPAATAKLGGKAKPQVSTESDNGTAKLYRDAKAVDALVAKGVLLRNDLAIGFLEVTGGPVVLQHQEHTGLRLPPGLYYIGGQIESAGFSERRVAD